MSGIVIELFHLYDAKKRLKSINKLIAQQSPGKRPRLKLEDLEEVFLNDNFQLYGAFEVKRSRRKLIGMSSIFFQRNLTRWIAEIHDVVVDEKYRGQGIGGQLVRALIQAADNFSLVCGGVPIKLYLTSRPNRVAANKLYKKLGFTQIGKATGKWGTNHYKKMI